MLQNLAMYKAKKRRIYLDYASASPVLATAIRAMRTTEKLVGNPSAIHAEGVAAKRALNDARERIAGVFGIKARELVFTPSLTAANSLAVIGFAQSLPSMVGTHWIVDTIEHPSIGECFHEIERMGGVVSYVAPDARGIITPAAVCDVLRPETVFVSVGWANSEIGIIQPLADIARALRVHEQTHRTRIAFHTDVGQAPLYESTLIHSLGVSLASFGSNKMYGPHGIGALYVRGDMGLRPVVYGGAQEKGWWSGTENVALATGFASACAEMVRHRHTEAIRVKKLRDHLAQRLCASIPDARVNGDLRCALPHILNVSIPGISGEYLALALDHAGIAVSTKSACREGETASHVVASLCGVSTDAWRASHTIRFSLGRGTKKRDIEYVVIVLSALVSARK